MIKILLMLQSLVLALDPDPFNADCTTVNIRGGHCEEIYPSDAFLMQSCFNCKTKKLC